MTARAAAPHRLCFDEPNPLTVRPDPGLRIAIDALIELRPASAAAPMKLASVAASIGVSISRLEQVFVPLREAGLVHGVRGPGGGYLLGAAADEIDLAQVACALRGLQAAGNAEPAPQRRRDVIETDLWCWLEALVMEELGRITLAEAAQRQADDTEAAQTARQT